MISVIICTYNRAKYIIKALDCLFDTTYKQYEVLVVDNNSTDNTSELLKAYIADNSSLPIKYYLETKQGLSNARNRGIAEAKGDILIFLDDDALVCPNYLNIVDEYLQKYPNIDAFGGKIIPIFDECDAPKWLCKWSESWVSGLNLGAKVCSFPTKIFPIGANMGFRKSVFDICGLFDPNLGRSAGNLIGGEEKDLFNRMYSHGMTILYLPNAVAEHVIPPKRTTIEYVCNFGLGVGISERIRTKANKTFGKRLFLELVKWGGTLVLALLNVLKLRFVCGTTLVRFRYNVTKGLLRRIEH